MKRSAKINTHTFGAVIGIGVPVFLMLAFWIWQSDGEGLITFFVRELVAKGVLTNVISASIFFGNLPPFMILCRTDNLKAARGMLGVTIVWAIAVFIIKLT